MLRMAVPTGYARVTFEYPSIGYSGTMTNTMAFQTAAALDGPLPGTYEWGLRAPALYTRYWKATLALVLSEGTELVNCRVETPDGVWEGGDEVSGTPTGTRNGVLMGPPELCTVVSLRGAGIGRQNRGRVYLPEALEDDWNINGPTSQLATAVEAAQASGIAWYDDLPEIIAGEPMATGPVVILHSVGGTPTPVTAMRPGQRVGRLRSRQS